MTPLRVLSMGWGKQTVALAYMAQLGAIEPFDFAVHAHTYEGEDADSYIERHGAEFTRFPILTARASEEVLQSGYVEAPSVEFFGQEIDASATLPESAELGEGQTNRQCTDHWKTAVIKRVIRTEMERRGVALEPGAVECTIGISWDESWRIKDSRVAYINNVYPLVDARMTREQCIQWMEARGLEVPPKSACDFCPFQTTDEWAHTMSRPRDRARALAADERIRWARPDKGPLFLHPARIPLAEAVKLPAGDQMRLCDGLAGCGL